MNRRQVLTSALATCMTAITPASGYAGSAPASLLVVRHRDYVNLCGRCIPGKLYGVPDHIELEGAEMAIGVLDELSDVIELPFVDNILRRSAIPVGTYRAFVREDGTKHWMWSGGQRGSGRVLQDRAWRLELRDVPGGRTYIQFHYGRDVSWSEGCFIVGTSPLNTCQQECSHGDSPEKGVARIREYVTSRMRASNQEVRIQVANGVFA